MVRSLQPKYSTTKHSFDYWILQVASQCHYTIYLSILLRSSDIALGLM